jgi:hypothetical protein
MTPNPSSSDLTLLTRSRVKGLRNFHIWDVLHVASETPSHFAKSVHEPVEGALVGEPSDQAYRIIPTPNEYLQQPCTERVRMPSPRTSSFTPHTPPSSRIPSSVVTHALRLTCTTLVWLSDNVGHFSLCSIHSTRLSNTRANTGESKFLALQNPFTQPHPNLSSCH